jgi:hypothetical protein
MKHIVTVALLLVFVLTLPAIGQGDRVVVSFISQNAYGNNLYLDNLTVGTQFGIDVAVASINNIRPDTIYAIGSTNTLVAPSASIINLGLSNITTPFTVTFTATPGSFTSTRTITSLAKGQLQDVIFDDLTIPVSTAMSFRLVSNLAGDLNRGNDTLRQNTIIFPGTQRKVLLEEWTSSTCAPCAANNPTIDAFIQSKFDSLVAIKYHVGWPSPGNDPMYLHNPTQSYDRRYYYGVNAVPHVVMDGEISPSYPYSNPPSLPAAFGSCTCEGTPIALSVSDTRLTNDTIQTNVALTILSPLRAGNYKLRVHAVERKVHYATPPGSNGEIDFFDVFRKAYPTSDGTVIPTSVGTYSFIFKYRRDVAVWVDSMIYTAVFVQNDVTKEIVNAAKGRQSTLFETKSIHPLAITITAKDRCTSSDQASTLVLPPIAPMHLLDGTFGYEIFEAAFPPLGWRRVNPDNSITWESYSGISGPSFGGNKAVKIDFYNYSTTGQTDTLYSGAFAGLRSADSLKFDWAYAMYSASYLDRLVVKLSKDGGATFPYTVFDRSGAALATAPTTTSEFVPSGSSQWATFAYSLAGVVGVEDENRQIPVRFDLTQNYPNPFNPSTLIEYSIPRTTEVRLTVYDVLGREVTTLVNGIENAGKHSVSFDSGNLASGLYLYRINAGEFSSSKKMIILK